jgi:hypothetical protein
MQSGFEKGAVSAAPQMPKECNNGFNRCDEILVLELQNPLDGPLVRLE